MRKHIIISVIIILSIVGLFIYKNSPTSSSGNSSDKATVLGVRTETDKGQIIDVRESDEYISGHADNAVNVPLGDILKGDFSKIDKTKPIYVYCRSGVRAGKAKVALEKAGYKNVNNLGGLSDWTAKGGLTCSSEKSSCS